MSYTGVPTLCRGGSLHTLHRCCSYLLPSNWHLQDLFAVEPGQLLATSAGWVIVWVAGANPTADGLAASKESLTQSMECGRDVSIHKVGETS